MIRGTYGGLQFAYIHKYHIYEAQLRIILIVELGYNLLDAPVSS